jgi:hypothetical protein
MELYMFFLKRTLCYIYVDTRNQDTTPLPFKLFVSTLQSASASLLFLGEVGLYLLRDGELV